MRKRDFGAAAASLPAAGDERGRRVRGRRAGHDRGLQAQQLFQYRFQQRDRAQMFLREHVLDGFASGQGLQRFGHRVGVQFVHLRRHHRQSVVVLEARMQTGPLRLDQCGRRGFRAGADDQVHGRSVQVQRVRARRVLAVVGGRARGRRGRIGLRILRALLAPAQAVADRQHRADREQGQADQIKHQRRSARLHVVDLPGQHHREPNRAGQQGQPQHELEGLHAAALRAPAMPGPSTLATQPVPHTNLILEAPVRCLKVSARPSAGRRRARVRGDPPHCANDHIFTSRERGFVRVQAATVAHAEAAVIAAIADANEGEGHGHAPCWRVTIRMSGRTIAGVERLNTPARTASRRPRRRNGAGAASARFSPPRPRAGRRGNGPSAPGGRSP
ncbi:hypothetical protein FE772_02925 [Lysobacter enzymogenes]|nr:hypothetical protein [Lysobacter enzymogenes]QCW24779.1 hypothetical protein FE772_02925 [Lysobacter enzymogenes]